MGKTAPGVCQLLILRIICIHFRYADNSWELCGKNMKRTYHICLSAGDEIFCRDEEDYIRCFNSLALALAETDSSLLADAIMSNHLHECVRTECPERLIALQRYKYARYFNAKYSRRGRLGERIPFVMELKGLYHTIAALSYVFRNSLHHGIVSTPFAYPHSSVCTIFQRETGHFQDHVVLSSRYYRSHIPSRNTCPKGYRMDKSGLILREDVVDVADVEHLYGTPRSFLYYMNRLSGEEWLREQERDKGIMAPVTIGRIEEGVACQSVERMLSNEHGRNDYRKMDDRGLCNLIDKVILPDMGKASVYLLSPSERSCIAERLFREYLLPEAQIRRCLHATTH